MGDDCWAKLNAPHHPTSKYAREVAAECNRAARNLAFALACVAHVKTGQSIAHEQKMSGWPALRFCEKALRRAGLWQEREGT